MCHDMHVHRDEDTHMQFVAIHNIYSQPLFYL